MLPAVHRLRSSSVFSTVTREGSRARRENVLAYCQATHAPHAPQVGLIVGKQVGNSVARHRVSRQLRAALTHVVATWPAGTVVVLRALPGAYSSGDLQEQAQSAAASAVARAHQASTP